MNRYMIGFVAVDDVLRVVFRGVVNIAFESCVRRDFPGDHTAHTAGFRIPGDMVAHLKTLLTWCSFSLFRPSRQRFKNEGLGGTNLIGRRPRAGTFEAFIDFGEIFQAFI
jgi:hypothetical protein